MRESRPRPRTGRLFFLLCGRRQEEEAKVKHAKSLLIASLGFVIATPAIAATYGFTNITNNNAGDAAIGEAQLFVDVIDSSPNVTFRFRNDGPSASVISEVYFDDGTLLGISSITDNPPDVDFMTDANPPDLPGGNFASPPFQVTAGFLAEAIPAPSMTGVGPNESVDISFALMGGGAWQDVIDDLGDGSLRIGIHVIAFDSGGSESFVTPEPASGMLLIAGAAGLLIRRRRR